MNGERHFLARVVAITESSHGTLADQNWNVEARAHNSLIYFDTDRPPAIGSEVAASIKWDPVLR